MKLLWVTVIHMYFQEVNFKTVEYFSKALRGEKTITRDNISVIRDKMMNRQGYSNSGSNNGKSSYDTR